MLYRQAGALLQQRQRWQRLLVPRILRLRLDGGRRRRRLVLHARGLKQVRPLAAVAAVAVPEVLAEVIGAEELFALVALAEVVSVGQMLAAHHPVRLRDIGESLPAIAAHVVGHRLPWRKQA